MIGTGGANGLATLLQFPEFDMTNPVVNSRSQRDPAAGAFGTRLTDLIGPEESVLLDQAGLDDEYFNSLFGLRGFAKKMLAQGIDVTGAPDPRDPKSMEAFNLFNTALPRHRQNAQRLKQAKVNQGILDKAFLDGKATFAKGEATPGNPLQVAGRNINQLATPNTPQFLQEYNQVLARTPQSQDEFDRLNEFREQALDDIYAQEQDGRIPPGSASLYESQLQPVRGFDDRLTQSKLAADRSLRNQRNSAANLNRERIKDLKNKDKPKNRGSIQNQFPEAAALSRFIKGEKETPGANAGAIFDGQFFTGRKMKNGADFSRIVSHSDGTYEIMFEKKSKDRRSGDETVEERVSVPFTEDNILPALFAGLTENEKEKMLSQMEESGVLSNGKLSFDEFSEDIQSNIPKISPEQSAGILSAINEMQSTTDPARKAELKTAVFGLFERLGLDTEEKQRDFLEGLE